ncbi:hypothetical protein PIB30_079275 [Stylosanthes scabra]|uniref:Uncharacterized protein n=1 Tax=Stylosanthes scabra TaxID=79078 RepID=A0ABU6TRS0_9FABA|nr:hypothetical protein [Stylosanthes scabra]
MRRLTTRNPTLLGTSPNIIFHLHQSVYVFARMTPRQSIGQRIYIKGHESRYTIQVGNSIRAAEAGRVSLMDTYTMSVPTDNTKGVEEPRLRGKGRSGINNFVEFLRTETMAEMNAEAVQETTSSGGSGQNSGTATVTTTQCQRRSRKSKGRS